MSTYSGVALAPAPISRTAGEPLFRRKVRGARSLYSFRALLVFVFLLYAHVAVWVPDLEVVRPAQLSVIAAGLLLAVEGVTGRRRLGLVWPESHLVLAFLVAAFLSSFDALWPHWAIDTSIELSKCVVAYFLVALSVDSTPRLRSFFWAMVLGGLFPALGTLHHYATGQLAEGRAGWIGIFANPNDVAYALVLLVPLAYALGARSSFLGRVLLVGCVLAYSAAIYTTFSRGGLLGFGAVIITMAIRVRSQLMRTMAVALMVMAGIAVSYYWHRADGFSGLSADPTFSQRLITLQAGLDMFYDHPLLGVGAGCSVIGFETYAAHGALTRKALTVHNTVVQAMAETGLMGSVPFVLLMICALLGAYKLSRRGRADDDPDLPTLMGGLQASLVGFVVCGLAGGYTMSWFPYLLYGLVSAARRIHAEKEPSALPRAA
jgi:O-antigen ligase